MEPSEARLAEIGQAIRAALDAEGNVAEELRVGRKLLVDHVASRSLRAAAGARRALGRRLVLGVVSAAVVCGSAVAWWRAPISFQVGRPSETAAALPGRLGDVIEASGPAAASLRFSEGSSIVLGGDGGRLRVLSVDTDGARVLLEGGRVDVSIAHRRRPGRWRFEAGPVAIQVTGTRFNADWDPKNRAFALELTEGSVVVSGPCLPTPRPVARGQKLRLSCPAAVAPGAAPPAIPAAPPVFPEAPVALMPPPGKTLALAPRGRRVATAVEGGPGADHVDGAKPSWQALVAAGRYADAIRAAELAGFTRACRSANAVELLGLADAARLSGRSERAVEALLALRQRFPRSGSAATAAFALGRIAFERRAAYADAARWFATYLDEQPTGPLMGDAVGRLMEARHRAGERGAARRDAERYLQRFPEGPYAPTARSILADE